jgi:hypothetical protein
VLAIGGAALAADLPMVGRVAAHVSAEPLSGTLAPFQYAAACSYDSCRAIVAAAALCARSSSSQVLVLACS